MKNGFPLLVLLCLLMYSCQSQEKISLEIPWYVKQRVKDDGVYHYNFQDSLKKYSAIHPKQVINKGNYFSYLANLHYESNTRDSIKTRQFLEKAYQEDTSGFCIHLIQPSYQYLKPNGRPHRRYTMPFILDYDLEYFLEKAEACKNCPDYQVEEAIDTLEYSRLLLYSSYISIRDQWYRIPSRTANPDKQTEFDQVNRALMNRLYENNPLPGDDQEIRANIWTLILHSDDCEWTKKWLGIYMATYKGHKRYAEHLNHFLWRSSCNNEYYRKIIKEEIGKIKK